MLHKFVAQRKYVLILLCVYIIVSTCVIVFQYRYITEYQYESMGERAENLAALAANAVKMTSKQMKELERMTFEESLKHPCNQRLKQLFELKEADNTIKYAYLIQKLPDQKVKYQVSEKDTDFYEYPPGTRLDYIWLMDVIVNENEQSKVNRTTGYYKDKNRYTHADQEIQTLYQSQKPGNLLWTDEWGTQISGLAPFYTTDGTYAGLIGVDIYSSSFFSYRNTILGLLLFMLLTPTLILTAFYIYLHLNYRKEMNTLAFVDQLTGIPNRRYYDVNATIILENAKVKKTPFTVILGDIDDFKRFNDTYGHPQGDVALIEVAEVFRTMARTVEGFAARYGGEEFILVSPLSDLKVFCKTVCKAVATRQILHTDGTESHISVSLGMHSCIPVMEDSLEDLVEKADKALYAAKKAGKNTFVLFQDM